MFCSLYSDRASHFFETPKAGERVSRDRFTQVGRALKELGIEAIPAYSQARGRSERGFRTWQGRLPQELRKAGIASIEGANQFLRDYYIEEFNGRFTVRAAQMGTAFVPVRRCDLDLVFSIQQERVVANDNTVRYENRVLQIEKAKWRRTLAGCRVTVYPAPGRNVECELRTTHCRSLHRRRNGPDETSGIGWRSRAVEKWKSG